MKIAPADTAPPRGLANAIQRVQANIDRRAARAESTEVVHTPGANALARLQANLQRQTGAAGETDPEPTPIDATTPLAPVDPIDASLIQPPTSPTTAPTTGLDLLA